MSDSNNYDDYFEPEVRQGECVRCHNAISQSDKAASKDRLVCGYCLNLLLKDD